MCLYIGRAVEYREDSLFRDKEEKKVGKIWNAWSVISILLETIANRNGSHVDISLLFFNAHKYVIVRVIVRHLDIQKDEEVWLV